MATQKQVDDLVNELAALYTERERVSTRIAEVSGQITSSARWTGGRDGRWVAVPDG